MSTKQIIRYVRTSLILYFFLQGSQTQMSSPCLKLLDYDPDNYTGSYYAVVNIFSGINLTGIWLRLSMDRPAIQLGNWFGRIDTKDNKDFLLENAYNTLPACEKYPLRFYVRYNHTGEPPRVQSVELNGKVLCSKDGVRTPFDDNGSKCPELKEEFAEVISPNSSNLSPSRDMECGTRAVFAVPLILYAKPTHTGQFPWHAAIYYLQETGLRYTCGGSLISKYHVITAGHCVSKRQSGEAFGVGKFVILFGKYYFDSWGEADVQTRRIEKIIPHPHFNFSTYQHNVALVKLAKGVEFTNYVRPVCLWEDEEALDPLVGKLGTVVGWGFDESGRPGEELRKLDIPVISNEACIYSYPDFYARYTSSETYCAGFTNGSSVCNGDSGGGMVFSKTTSGGKVVSYLRGIVSLSVALDNKFSCDPSHYTVFVDTARYHAFIKDAMQQ